MGAVVVDSSVVIGFVTSADAHHQSAVAEIRAARIRDDMLVLPATVLAESLVGSQRAGAAIAEQMRRDLIGFFGPVRMVDEQVAFATSALRGRFPSVRLPDALVIATGVVEDAVVLTCDKRLAAVDPRVQVVGG
jgi:predicted nucleic acid-binding protein